jgi:hypothetical protein
VILVLRMFELALSGALALGVVATGATPAFAQEYAPYLTIDAAPAGAQVSAGEHFDGTELTNTRPVADGAVSSAPVFLADDQYGCQWTTAAGSGADRWIALVQRNAAVPDGLVESPCALFQAKVAAATAAGADALIIINLAPGHEAGTAAGTIPAMMIDQGAGNRLRASLNPADPQAVKATLGLLDPETWLPPGANVPTTVGTLTASASGSQVTVSGSATFRGESPVLIAEDAAGDAPIDQGLAARTGVDLLGAYIFQPDPATPELVFEMRLTGLPQSGSLPEVIRYGFPFTAGTSNFQIQAKFSNLGSLTVPDDPQGHAEHAAGTSFQLRGNCGLFQGVVNNCAHLGWLTGEFDVADAAVRVRLPIGSSLAPTVVPGAVLDRNPASFSGNPVASYQAVVSNDSTQDAANWEEGVTYRVPARTVTFGIVPAGSPAQFTQAGTVSGDGSLQGTLSTAGLAAGSYDVWAKACFGTNCGTSSTTITI